MQYSWMVNCGSRLGGADKIGESPVSAYGSLSELYCVDIESDPEETKRLNCLGGDKLVRDGCDAFQLDGRQHGQIGSEELKIAVQARSYPV